jgi:beta-galactosidase
MEAGRTDIYCREGTSGAGTIAAVGNGDLASEELYKSDERSVFQGRALVVVRASQKTGPIVINASSPGLAGASVRLRAQAFPPRRAIRQAGWLRQHDSEGENGR